MDSFEADFTRKDVGEIIESVRIKMQLNMDAFASHLNITLPQLAAAESGGRNVYEVFEKMQFNKLIAPSFKVKILLEK